MVKFKLNLRNVVAIAICLAGFSVFSGCDKENLDNDNENTNNKQSELDKGFGCFKYNGETYYLQRDPLFSGRVLTCDEYFINEQNPFGGWRVHQWWYQSYGVSQAKAGDGNYAYLRFLVVNSDFSPPIGTFTNVKFDEPDSGWDCECKEDLEKGVICGPNSGGAGIANGYGIPDISIEKKNRQGDYEYTDDGIISGSIEVSRVGGGCEVNGSFTTQSGKTIELSYKGTFKE